MADELFPPALSTDDLLAIEEIMERDAPDVLLRRDFRKSSEWRWQAVDLEARIALAAWRQQPIEARAGALIDAIRAGMLA